MNIPSSDAWIVDSDGQVIEIHGRCGFGRAPQNAVVVSSALASRNHALIHAQGAEYWLVDLGSRNGTELNHRPLVRPARLRDGDEIGVGEVTYRFHQHESPLTVDQVLGAPTQGVVREEDHWLLVADIENFTPLSRKLEPKQLAHTVNHWLSACRERIEEHAGAINNYTGDGFFAHWRDHEQARQAVAKTLRALRTACIADHLEFRVVVHLGKVGRGAVDGGGQALFGAEVNFVFRLEKAAADLKLPVLLSQPAAARLMEDLPLKQAGDVTLKGFSGAHAVFTLAE